MYVHRYVCVRVCVCINIVFESYLCQWVIQWCMPTEGCVIWLPNFLTPRALVLLYRVLFVLCLMHPKNSPLQLLYGYRMEFFALDASTCSVTLDEFSPISTLSSSTTLRNVHDSIVVFVVVHVLLCVSLEECNSRRNIEGLFTNFTTFFRPWHTT